MSIFVPMTGHMSQWGGDMWMARGPGARLTIDFSQEYLSLPPIGSYAVPVKGKTMRVVFNLEIKAEIDSFDTKQREVFIRLMTEAAKQLHTKAVLLSQKVSPNMKLTVADTGGNKSINVFAGEDNV